MKKKSLYTISGDDSSSQSSSSSDGSGDNAGILLGNTNKSKGELNLKGSSAIQKPVRSVSPSVERPSDTSTEATTPTKDSANIKNKVLPRKDSLPRKKEKTVTTKSESSDDDESGWSSSDGEGSSSTVELDDIITEKTPQLLAKGRVDVVPAAEDNDRTPKKGNLPSFLQKKNTAVSEKNVIVDSPAAVSTPEKTATTSESDDETKSKSNKSDKKNKKDKDDDDDMLAPPKKKSDKADKVTKEKKAKTEKKKDKKKDGEGDPDDPEKPDGSSKKGKKEKKKKDSAKDGDSKDKKKDKGKTKKESKDKRNKSVGPSTEPTELDVQPDIKDSDTGKHDEPEESDEFTATANPDEIDEGEGDAEVVPTTSAPVDVDEMEVDDDETDDSPPKTEPPKTQKEDNTNDTKNKKGFFGFGKGKISKNVDKKGAESSAPERMSTLGFGKRSDSSGNVSLTDSQVMAALDRFVDSDDDRSHDKEEIADKGSKDVVILSIENPENEEANANEELDFGHLQGVADQIEKEEEETKNAKKKSGFFSLFGRRKRETPSSVVPMETQQSIPAVNSGENAYDGNISIGDDEDLKEMDEQDDRDGEDDGEADDDGNEQEKDSPQSEESPRVAQRRNRGFMGLFGARSKNAQITPPETDIENNTPYGEEGDEEDSDLEEGRRELFPTDGDGDEPSELRKGNATKATSEPSPPERFSLVKMVLLLTLAGIVMILATIGTAYWGTKLATRKSSYVINPEGLPPNVVQAPTMSPTRQQICEYGDNDLLEFVLTFDSRPSEVGFTMYDVTSSGAHGTGIWIMEPGTFQSFNQFQRKNIFRLCISSAPTYHFKVMDSGDNGLVSRLGASFVYGHWQLRFNNEIMASYQGDCSINQTALDLPDATDRTTYICGEYSTCLFQIGGNTTGGSCQVGPNDEDPTSIPIPSPSPVAATNNDAETSAPSMPPVVVVEPPENDSPTAEPTTTPDDGTEDGGDSSGDDTESETTEGASQRG